MSFTFIAQKRMGKLRPADDKELKRIEARRDVLVAELQALDDAEQTVLTKTTQRLKIDTEGPFRGVHIEDDGTVYALYCSCVGCQATLNNVSVKEATEAMIAMGHIHADMAPQMRQQAAALDKKRGSTVVH